MKEYEYTQELKELKIDEWIWIVFIILSVLNIFGDEYEKDFYTKNDTQKDQTAKKIFTFTVFISFLIYAYLLYQRYNRVKLMRSQGRDTSLGEIRLFGSILVVTASLLFLYTQIKENKKNNPSIE